jgi:hypothetical protein
MKPSQKHLTIPTIGQRRSGRPLKRHSIRAKKVLIFLFVIAGLVQFACKKNSNSGPPTVTGVRTVTPAEKDSLFTQALPGSLIVIQGSGFSGLQAVYFNDSIAAFNPVYVTNNNIIINIPNGAQSAATNPNVPSAIRIITNHGSTSYTFHIVLNGPVITGIAIDSTGTNLVITGANLVGVQKITFPVPGVDSSPSFVADTNRQLVTAAIPSGTPTADSVRVYCTFGVASFPYPPPANILSISNENALAGTTIVINGHNFIGIQHVFFPGGIEGTNLVTNSVNQLSVTVPAGITTTDSLRLTGASSGVSPQLFDSYITHPSPGYISTFENQWPEVADNTGWLSWSGGAANASTAATSYPGATGGVGLLLQGGILGANAGPTSQANAGDLQMNDNPWVSNTSTPIANYSLKFEIYVTNAWKGGEIWIAVGDWYKWNSYIARYAPWDTAAGGVYQPSGWTTVTIPLTQFILGNYANSTSWATGGSPATLFSDYAYSSVGFLLTNDQASSVSVANGVNVAIDNVRIVQGQ